MRQAFEEASEGVAFGPLQLSVLEGVYWAVVSGRNTFNPVWTKEQEAVYLLRAWDQGSTL